MARITKTYLKTWSIKDYWRYNIYKVQTDSFSWLVAEPITPGTVTRCADNETELRILLENDCTNVIKRNAKPRIR